MPVRTKERIRSHAYTDGAASGSSPGSSVLTQDTSTWTGSGDRTARSSAAQFESLKFSSCLEIHNQTALMFSTLSSLDVFNISHSSSHFISLSKCTRLKRLTEEYEHFLEGVIVPPITVSHYPVGNTAAPLAASHQLNRLRVESTAKAIRYALIYFN